ncbi:MAG: Uma2 family endonuclease [Acidimicrobiales bacterium]
MTEAVDSCTWDEFLAGEARGGPRHELVGGRVFAMAGGTERHDLLAGQLFAALFAAAPPGCRVFTQNRLVRVAANTGYYPDVVMVCGPAAHERWEGDASVIIEVLSSSTEDTDRREKAVAYAALPGLAR